MTITGSIEQAGTNAYLFPDVLVGDLVFRSFTSNNFIFGFNSNRPSALNIKPTGTFINGDPSVYGSANVHMVRNSSQMHANDIIGNLVFATSSNFSAQPIVMSSISTVYTGTGTSKNGDITFNTESGSGLAEQLRITSTGLVGIGTSQPTVKLDVNGVVRSKAFFASYYGTPSLYNSSFASATGNTPGYYYTSFPSNSNVNFTPIVTNNVKYGVPVNGIYLIKFSFSLGSPPVEAFISKNMGNGSDLGTNDDRLIAVSYTSGSSQGTISGIANMTTTDFICAGFSMSSGSVTLGTRNTLQIVLLNAV